MSDVSNTLGLAEARHILSSSFSPSFLKPVWIREKCGHLILIRFCPNSTTKNISELENVKWQIQPLSWKPSQDLCQSTPDSLTFSKQAKHFHFFVPVARAPFHPLTLLIDSCSQVPAQRHLLHEGFLHRPTCRHSHGPLNSCRTSPGAQRPSILCCFMLQWLLNHVNRALTDVVLDVKLSTLIKGLHKKRQTRTGICGKAVAKNINYCDINVPRWASR